ncbi:MAG: hypothetical protein IT328_10410 [Caldilineaceae bacterium]|nr:hypothetical protein [Caldilineaceae bacterium]
MDDEELSPGRLMVVEQEGVFIVVSEDDPSDWVASFTQDDKFPARDWAERMADLYNLRGEGDFVHGPDCPPRFTGTHHPFVQP